MAIKVILEDVTKIYEGELGALVALDRLTLQVEENQILGVVGPSGCGKTTMLNLIARFIEPTRGRVGIEPQKRHTRCAVVFQQDSVFPWMTVAENVGYALLFNGTDKIEGRRVVERYLKMVGLDEFAGNWPRELSGGMRKRVDLARAYAASADILLLDEPFGSLDMLTKDEMQQLLLKIWQRENKTIIFVTHDVEEALFVGHRVAVMTPRPGRVKRVLDVPFSMPRNPSLKLTPAFLETRRQIVAEMAGAGQP